MNIHATLLKDLVIDVNSGFASGEDIPDGVLQVRMNNVDTAGNLNWNKKRRVPTSEKLISKYSLEPNDIIFNHTNSPSLVGKCALFHGLDEPVVFSNHFLRIRTNVDRLLPSFLVRWLVSQYSTGIFRLRSNQWVNQATLRQEDLLNLKIPLPPLSEQKRIAAILDKADEIRKKRKEAIHLTDDFLRSAFLEMFGDPVTNPKKWKVVKLGEVITGKPNNGVFRKNDEYGGDFPVVWVKELFNGHILDTTASRALNPTDNELKKFALKRGDILFCRSSLKLEGVGYTNVFLGEDASALFECHLIRVSPDKTKVNGVFLNFLFRHPGLRAQIVNLSNTVTMSTIGQEQVCDIRHILPPIEMQDAFSSLLLDMLEKQRDQSKFLLNADTLFGSLVQRAFKGEL